jgi:hypothetical protein
MHRLLTPIILRTWEAEIWRTVVPGQPGQKSLQDPILTEKSWAWSHAPVIPVMEDGGPGPPR